MKSTLTILFLFLAITGSALAQKKVKGVAIIKTTINCDHCKACETCGQNFQTNMLKMKGVKMYELNEIEQTITVYYNPKKIDLSTIKTGITNFGYDADELKANADAYAKLDGCCKPKTSK